MKINIPVELIKGDLQIAGLLATAGDAHSMMGGNIQFTIRNSVLTIMASDYIETFKSSHKLDIDEFIDISYYINTKQLLMAVKKIKKGNVTFEFDKEEVVVTHGKFKLTIFVMPVDINIKAEHPDTIFETEFSHDEMKELVRISKFFSGKSSFGNAVSGIWIKKYDKDSIMVITDRKRTFYKVMDTELPDDFEAIIPINLIKNSLSFGKANFKFKIGRHLTEVSFENRTIVSPNIMTSIPKSLKKTIDAITVSDRYMEIDKEKFLESISYVKPFTGEFEDIYINFSGKNINLKCRNASVDIECKTVGEFPRGIRVSIKSLENILNFYPDQNGKLVKLYLNNKNNCIFTTHYDCKIKLLGMLLIYGR